MTRQHALTLIIVVVGVLSFGTSDVAAQTSDWCETFDFTVSDGGWEVFDSQSTYVAGQGWKSVGDTPPSKDKNYIERSFTSTALTRIRVYVSNPQPSWDTGAGDGQMTLEDGSGVFWSTNVSGLPIPLYYEWSGMKTTNTIISRNFPYSSSQWLITSIEFCGTGTSPFATPPVADAGNDRLVMDDDNSGSQSVTLNGSGSYDPDGGDLTYAWTEGGTEIATGVSPDVLLTVGTHTIILTVTDDEGDTATDTIIIIVDEMPDNPKPSPLNDDDLHPIYPYQETSFLPTYGWAAHNNLKSFGEGTLHAVSRAPGALVHSIGEGTVTEIRDFHSFSNAFGQDGECGVENILSLNSKPNCFVYLEGSEGADYYLSINQISGVLEQLSIVVVTSGDIETRYLVADAAQYVSEGQTVGLGCVLGKTARTGQGAQANDQDGVFPDDVDLLPPDMLEFVNEHWSQVSSRGDYGIALIHKYNTAAEIGNTLKPAVIYPDSDRACVANPAFADCLGSNPDFRNNAEGWQGNYDTRSSHVVNVTDTDYTPSDYPVVLDAGEYIQRTMAIDESQNLQVTVSAVQISDFGTTRPAQIVIYVDGESSQAFDLSVSENNALTINAGTLSAAPVHTVGVRAVSSSASVGLRFLCASTGSPVTVSNGCYFNNPHFDYGGSGWTAAGALSVGEGFVKAVSGESISQSVHLYPGDYTVTVETIGVSPVNGTYAAAPPLMVDFDYTYGAYSGSHSLAPSGEIADELTVTAETDAAFNITFTAMDMDDFALSDAWVHVSSVCISPVGGGGFPGYDIPPPAYETTCAVISPDDTDSIVNQTRWHWAHLDQFFTCDLMKSLNAIHETTMDTYKLGEKQLRYGRAMMWYTSDYAETQFVPWLDGWFRAIVGDNLTTGGIYWTGTSDGGCGLFCALSHMFDAVASLGDTIGDIIMTLIGYLDSVINGFLDIVGIIVQGLIDLLMMAADGLFGLLTTAEDLLVGLITSYNDAEPEAIAGGLDCVAYPKSSPLCTGVWVLDNTVFADDSPGIILMYLMISIGSIFLITWAVGDIKRTIIDAGKVA
jgi:hypothetical protein